MINLKQLGQVGTEAITLYHRVMVDALDKPNEDPYEEAKSDLNLAWDVRCYLQFKNLFDNLTKLKGICEDYAAGNLGKYIDEFNEYAEEGDVWDPFWDIEYIFEGDRTSLPATLETYAHFKTLTERYSELVKAKREGFTQFFGDKITLFRTIENEEGELERVPESEIPSDMLNQMNVNLEIAEIQADYCLDGYNSFYAEVTKAFPVFKANNDLIGFANLILSHFQE